MQCPGTNIFIIANLKQNFHYFLKKINDKNEDQ